MAGEGVPLYMPMLWPIGHVATAINKPDDDNPKKNEALPIINLVGNLTAMVAAIRNFALAVLCVYSIPKLQGVEYPAFGAARSISWEWMWPIFVRNIVGTWAICGFWDWFLYFSPFKKKLHKYKMNQVYPSMAQFKHDAFYTTLASCWAACIEIILCHLWSTGTLQAQKSLRDTPILNVILVATLTHWRTPHFHLMHRSMHPWKTTRIPDIGKFLYRHIHSLHHKSYNPTAFSGTNMHPIEATLYYTAALIPVAFGLHPVFAVGVIIDCAISAWLGHDGFQWPGSGDYFHLLHHQHFDGNYGAIHVPLDWLFGTFISCKGDLKKVWSGRSAGEDVNETAVHKASAKEDKVE